MHCSVVVTSVLLLLFCAATLAHLGVRREKLKQELNKNGHHQTFDFKAGGPPPNVVLFIADDLGFGDVSWNNPDVRMPRLEAIAKKGVILDNNYMYAVCGPSRASLMTGRYNHRIGQQHTNVNADNCLCLPHTEETLGAKMQTLGYSSHVLGKWHLGHCNIDCFPTNRGFDTFKGFLSSHVDFFNHTHDVNNAYDWRDGERIAYKEVDGIYTTDLLTDEALKLFEEKQHGGSPFFLYLAHGAVHSPIQATQQYLDMVSDLPPGDTTTYAAMLLGLENSVVRIIEDLEKRDMMKDTIFVFISDNGAIPLVGNNLNLRGSKGSVYEGGIHTPAFVYSPRLEKTGYRSKQVFHVTDWFPTIASLAGGTYDEEMIDGVDHTSSKAWREECLIQFDSLTPEFLGRGAIRIGNFKYILGFPGLYDGWQSDGNIDLTHLADIITNGSWVAPPPSEHIVELSLGFVLDLVAVADYADFVRDYQQLYNLAEDPAERYNLAASMPKKCAEMRQRLLSYAPGEYPLDRRVNVAVPKADPSHFGGVVSPGWCPPHVMDMYTDPTFESPVEEPVSYLDALDQELGLDRKRKALKLLDQHGLKP